MTTELGWYLVGRDSGELPRASERSLPDPATSACELCGQRPKQPMSTVLVINGPAGMPVPFLICAQCRRTLDELHALLESAAAAQSADTL